MRSPTDAFLSRATRLNIDRFYALMRLRTELFQNVEPHGSKGEALKVDPQSHVSPFTIVFEWEQVPGRWQQAYVGVTDHVAKKEVRVGPSGVKIYVSLRQQLVGDGC